MRLARTFKIGFGERFRVLKYENEAENLLCDILLSDFSDIHLHSIKHNDFELRFDGDCFVLKVGTLRFSGVFYHSQGVIDIERVYSYELRRYISMDYCSEALVVRLSDSENEIEIWEYKDEKEEVI